jgi:Putative bacterial sensory transduction regulator
VIVADRAQVLRDYLDGAGLEWEASTASTFVVTLVGEQKLRTSVALTLGEHALTINAFVARNPDENHQKVYRWLLERNRRMFAVSFAVDHLGDIYLVGRLPLESVTPEELDRLMGSVLEYSDSSFNTILDLGFATAIRKEWAWRRSRGESTANLSAFTHLADDVTDAVPPTRSPDAAG